MDKVLLSVELVNGILNYLASRPYVEVAGIISAIQEEAAPQAAQPTIPTAEVPPAPEEAAPAA